MDRVDELLAWLARRRPTCSTCGAALWAIAGPDGIRASSCPTCDVTPVAVPIGEVRPRSHGALVRRI